MSRGPDPEDARAFRPEALPALVDAVADLSWLRGRGYAEDAALKLVGDKHQLAARQRKAVQRAACSDEELRWRREHLRPLEGRIAVDGFNVLIGLERAISGGPLFRGRDGALRDIAGVHGTWRRSGVTGEAVERLAETLPHEAVVVLDRPVSNSGRLAAALRERSEQGALGWEIEVVDHADRRLVELELPVATGDAWILDRRPWVDLLGALTSAIEGAWIVELGAGRTT
ncbi:MAG: DUF434 domain-containing protein [Alphaproteobacteria bacterium]|nr:DUF434 domain-containing protein [Alphaproteobacteria bacterium]